MESELKRLKIILGVFGSSYLIRALLDSFLGAFLPRFISLQSEYEGSTAFGFLIFYFTSDILPISLIYWMHHLNYRQV